MIFNKKILNSFLISIITIILIFTVLGCKKDKKDENKTPEKLSIVTVNDFHGAILETNGEFGAARLASYINYTRENNSKGTIVLSAGDMFQGTGISNIKYGYNVVEIMNKLSFDAMTIGNHEFDWGLNEILKYRDGSNDNGEALFPLLGANISLKSSSNDELNPTLPDNVEPYKIISRGDLKIGIIGYIGLGLENDIATSMVSDYEFLNPVPIVSKLAKKLRTEEGVHVVIALGHDGSATTNRALADLTGDMRVDAIVNGHLHLESYDYLGTTERKIPVVQASSSGKCAGLITFDVDKTTLSISNPEVTTMPLDIYKKDDAIASYVATVEAENAPYFNRVIGIAYRDLSRSDLQCWTADVIKESLNTDVGVINLGGIRNDAFPINANQEITISKIYQIMPFDNTVKTCELSGSLIKSLAQNPNVQVSTNIERNGGSVLLNGYQINDNDYYSVAAVDYIFDKEEYPFLRGQNIVKSGLLTRDLMIASIEKDTEEGLKWFE